MECSGKCYCGKGCKVDHENIALRCDCGGDPHNGCNNKCSKCADTRCAYIANHKTRFGNCLCMLCNFYEMNDYIRIKQ